MDITERRRLTDLYSRGELVTIDDGEGDTVSVWLRKLTPTDAETAYVKASAKRAAFFALARQDPPSEVAQMFRAEVDNFSKDDLILWLTAQELVKRREVIEMRISFDEKWQKDRYLSGLQERLIQDDFQSKAALNPDDDEVVLVNAELDRYADEVEGAVQKEKTELMDEYGALPNEEMRQKALDLLLEGQADAAWVYEFQRSQIWLCTFDPENRRQRVFRDRAEVDELQTEVMGRLIEVLDRLHVGDAQGKDSQQTPDSSQPVE